MKVIIEGADHVARTHEVPEGSKLSSLQSLEGVTIIDSITGNEVTRDVELRDGDRYEVVKKTAAAGL